MGCLCCTGTLIPIIVLIIQLIIDTISNLSVYEIQLLHEFDYTHGTSATMPVCYSQTGFDIAKVL